LRDEVALRPAETITAWLASLVCLFEADLADGMPAHTKATTFRDAERRARNAEETLLAALNACARVRDKDAVTIEGFSEDARALVQGRLSYIGRRCLSHLNLSEADLSWADLSWADLALADLHRADLRNVVLDILPSLTEAQLTSAQYRPEDPPTTAKV
jgi:Pentapeptide repeats (8 copies)